MPPHLSEVPTKLDVNLSTHTARHTYAVMALDCGISTGILSKLLGHKSVAATEKFYARRLYPNQDE